MKSFCLFKSVFGARLSVLLWCAFGSCLAAQGALPVITQQPVRTNVMVGETAFFQVVASGTAPLFYQWRTSTNLPNETNATLVLSNLQSSQAGAYKVVVSNAEGSTTSVVAQLVVRPLGASVYLPPPGGWTYRYEGDSLATPGTAALDGTWNHDNGSDAWAGDWRGAANPPVGGLSITNGILTLEDDLASGAGNDNRRLYFTHPLSQDPVTNANTILNDGVTLTFRARLTPPSDPLMELTNAPDGFINVADGKGMIGMRQSGSSGMIISFSLNMLNEDTNATTLYTFPASGLHMNNLNTNAGNARSDKVDPGEEGIVNVFPLDPTTFHEFWITIQDNGVADPGTHRVTVYVDGSTAPTIFNVTAGIGSDTPITNYLAIGLPSTFQRGAFDLDWVGYRPGVYVPSEATVPVQITSQPASQIVNEGQTATFTVAVTGTEPITYQWNRNGAPISGANASSYTTGALLPPDSGAVFTVDCQNAIGTVTSDPATLTVIGDSTPPALVSAASLNGQMIGVCFSERVTAASAQNTANYFVNNGAVTVTSATLRTNANNTTVLLQVTGLASQADTVFTVRATNIIDASFAGNRGGGTVQGVVHGLAPTNIGVLNGASFTCTSNRFEIAAGGTGLGGTADGFHFAYMPRTGDFDVRVRLSRLDTSNALAQAGLVARIDQTAGSRSLNAFVNALPGDNAYHATYRATANGATAPWSGSSDKLGVPLPDAWIRLARAGDVFTAYCSTNGTDWTSYAQRTESLPATILVGLAGANLADSVLDQLIFIPPPVIVTPPSSMVATNGDTVSFSVLATSKGDIRYQWLVNSVDLLNQTNVTLVLSNVNPSQAGSYQVRVSNGGGSVLSAVATLTVRTLDYGDAPASYGTLLADNGARHVIVPGVRLGATVDFELNGAPSVGANGDDLNGSDDEDGVNFVTPLWVDQTATLEVVASTNGVLNAWIDFGADGSFAQPGDQVFVDYALDPGTNLLSLIVPFDAKGTNTFARFRFSTVGGLGPTGIAPDGEVEDYAVTIIPVADLSITATDSPDPVAVGSNLTYRVTVGNVGPAVATGVTVTNRFSTAVDFVSATSTRGSCVNNAGAINCAIGDLGVSSNAVITIVVRPQGTDTLTSTFGISADQPDPNTGNNSFLSSTTVETAPSITTPPSSLTVTQHNTATFSVTAGGTAPLTYQWFQNSNALATGTSATLVILDAQSTNQGTYQVRITNRVGGTISAPVTLTVLDPPTITQQPQSRTNFAGGTATFTVVAQGTPPLSYQWRLNGTTVLTGETRATLTLTNVQKSHAGTYSVRIVNSAGTLDSAGAVLTVFEVDFGDAPAPFPTLLADNGARHRIVPGFYLGAGVDFEPDGQADDGSDEDGVIFRSPFLLGQTVRIDVVASSNGVLNAWLDWNGNGSWTNAGEQIFTNQSLTAGTNILNAFVPGTAQLGVRAARFRFSTATNLLFVGEALDGEVEDYLVSVGSAMDVRVSASTTPTTVRLGSNVVYSIGVSNAGPASASGVILTSSLPTSVTVVSIPPGCANQGGGVISCNLGTIVAQGSTNLQITTRPTQVGNVTNSISAYGVEFDVTLTNNVAQSVISVLDFPAITSQPQNATVISGDSATFQVSATGTALSYQWTFNSGDLSGATDSTLVISPARPANEGAYRVRVSNALGQVTSDPAQLTVVVPPAITTQPSSVSVNAGSNATFSVTATGTAPLSYQWISAAGDMPGRTSATLTISNVSSADEGAYRVRVSNTAGSVVSDPATLSVLAGVTITQQPQSQTAFAGSTASLQVIATGSQPLSYQWFFRGTNRLNGATSPTLLIPNAQVTNSGPYSVLVSNRVNTATSTVAQLTVREADFGDAPGANYATLLVFNGAYHYLAPGVFLGSGVDFEADGQPSANANGDDLAGQDDEDGVTFVTPLLVGQIGRVSVVASTNGFLDAWLDFNANGDWTDLGEQIFASKPLVRGTNLLQFNIPASAATGTTVSRFRFSTVGGLLFSGGAPDGEVEDHLATIFPAVDLSVSLIDQPDPVLVGNNLHLFLTISNAGPSIASGVTLREQLPTSTSLVSANFSQGSCSNQAGILVCDFGALAGRGTITGDITLMPRGIGTAAHRAEVSCVEQDLNSSNNVAIQLTTVVTPSGSFSNSQYIAINDLGPASVYPSTITVSGVTGTVQQIIVTLNGLSHSYPDDIDMLLVGPSGQRALIMSDAGGGFDPAYITFSLDDTSDLVLPDENLIIDEVYRPANYDGADADTFAAPAPAGPYTNRLAAFKGTDPNGVWSLYIMDDAALDTGELVGGWSLDFFVLDPIADASVGMTAAPNPAAVGQNLTYTLQLTNRGPAGAAMLLTNILPASVIFQSATPSQGQCANAAGQVTCDFGSIEGGASASVAIVVTPQQAGVVSNWARVTPSQLDLNLTNNSASLLTTVRFATDVSIAMTESQDPVPFGQPFTYTLTVSNRGPQLAQALTVTDQLPSGFSFTSASASQGSCTNQSGIVTCNLGDLSVGSFATIQITGQGARIARMTNNASVQGNIIDTNASNNQWTEETVIVFAAPAVVNAAGITVPNPYPSTLQVSGLTGAVYKVSVVISNLNNSAPESLQLLLVGPSGENVLLMNAVGGNNAVVNATVRLDDQAAIALPDNTALVTGTYRPASYSPPASSLPAPAPPTPYGTALTVFRGTDANGTWSLFTRGGGTIGAWALEISTLEPIADLSVNVVSQPTAVSVGSNLTYTVTVSNRGPATATGVVLTNVLPSTFRVTSATGCTNICNIGPIAARGQIQYRVDGVAVAEGAATNRVSAFALERDVNPTNNIAVAVTTMKTPPIISSQPQNLTVTNGDAATFSVGITGAGPFTYQWLRNGSAVAGGTAAALIISNAQQGDVGDYTVRVSDGVGSPLSASAHLTVLNRPTITDIPDITILEDTPSNDLPFTIGDLESSVLALEVATSNLGLIPLSNIVISGTGNNRTVRVLPATNQFGVATVTITVRDSDGIPASDSFTVTVLSVNDLPVLAAIPNQVMDEDTQRTILLQGSDVEDAPSQLTLSASANNTNLIALAIVNRTLTITGLPDQFGSTRVTVVLTDSTAASVSNAFDVAVNPVNDPPTLDAVAPVFIDQRSGLKVVQLTGISGGPANEPQNVTVSASTADTNLVGNLLISYTSGASGSLSFETVSNHAGSTTVTVTVDDGAASSNIVRRTFTVSISDTNDPPMMLSIGDQTTAEDTPLQVSVTVGDEETPVNLLVVAATSSNTNLVRNSSLNVSGTNATRTLSLTPEPDASGSTFITISVTDGNNSTVTTSFQLQVVPVNDPPTLEVDPVLNLPRNASPKVMSLRNVTAGAADEMQDLLIIASSSNPALIPDPAVSYTSPNTNGTLTLVPQPATAGTAVITIVVNDHGASNNVTARTLTVNVSGDNSAPTIARIFNQTTPEDTPIDIPFSVSDPEGPADALTVSATSGNTSLIPNETLVVTGTGGNRSLRAVPVANASGTASITVTVTDGDGASATATLNLEVSPVNDPPVIGDIPDQQTSEDTVLGPLFFYVNDLETSPDALTLSALTSNPQLVPQSRITFGGAGTNRWIQVVPTANLAGAATIMVTVQDSEGRTASDSFVLSVQATNDPPLISTIADQTINIGTSALVPFTINDQETDPNALTLTVTSSNPAILPFTNIVLGGSSVNRFISLTPVPNTLGTSTVSVAVADAAGATASTTFTFAVTAGSGTPVITVQPENVTVTNGDSATLSVTAAGSPTLQYRWRFNGTNLPAGTNRSLVLANVNSSDAGPYSVVVSNSFGSATSIVAALTVINRNGATPTISNIVDQTISEDVPLTLTINLQDSDTAANFLVLTASGTNATLVPSTNYFFDGAGFTRTLTIVPATNQFGTNLVTVSVSDGTNSTSRNFVLRVNPVNDAPTLDRIANVSAVPNSTVTIPLTGISPGAPNETTAVTITAAHNNPAVLTNLIVNYTPGATSGSITMSVLVGATGSATVTVTASDGGLSTIRTFQIQVRAATNANPTFSNVNTNVVIAEDTSSGAIPFNVDDDIAANQISITALSLNTNLISSSGISLSGSGKNRTITLIPNTNQFGSAIISLTAADAASGLATTNFLLTVTPVNDLPSISAIPNQVLNEDIPSAPIPIVVRDIETPAAFLTLTGSSSNPSLIPNTNLFFGGSGSNRVLVLKAINPLTGTAVITVTVTDQNGGSASTNFSVTVNSFNDTPIISDIADVSIPMNTSTGPISFTVTDEETPASSLTVSASAADTALVPAGNITLSGTTSSRVINIQPATNAAGSSTITISASDGNTTATKTFLLRVTRPPTNAPPTLDSLPDLFVNEDSGPVTVNLTGISAGGEPNQIVAISARSSNRDLVPDPIVTYTSLSSTGSLSLSPLPGTNGFADITVSAHDGKDILSRTFRVTVRARPVLSRIVDFAIDEDVTSAPVSFLASDVETPASNLLFAVASSNPAIIPASNVVISGPDTGTNRTLTVSGAPNQFGYSVITLTVTDSDGLSRSNSFIVIVNPVNDPPTLAPISPVTMSEDQGAFTVNLSGISSGAANEVQPLTLDVSSSNPGLLPVPVISYISPNTTASLTFTPVANAFGSATVTVLVNDGQSTNQFFSRTFQVTINPVDDPPTLNAIPDLVLDYNSGPTNVPLSGISAGNANEGQIATVQASSSNPLVISNLTVSYNYPSSLGSLAVAPNPGASGSATITVTVSDGPNSVSQTFAVTVNPAPILLTVGTIADQTIVEDAVVGPISFFVADDGQHILDLSAVSSNPTLIAPADITFGGSGTNRTITLSPETNRFGTATITVIARTSSQTASNSFQLTVTAVDDFPYFIQRVPDSVVMDEDTRLEIPFYVGDPEDSPYSLIVGVTSYNPGLFPNDRAYIDLLYTYGADGTKRGIVLKPATNQFGTALIELRVRDKVFHRSTNNFIVTVRPVNDLPTITPIPDQTITEDTTLEVGFFVEDVEAPSANLVVTATSSDTNLVANESFEHINNGLTRYLRLTPALNRSGTNTITITVHDADGGTATTSFNLRVLPVNDPPTISAISPAATSIGVPTAPLLFTMQDVESPADQLTLAARSSNTNLAPIGNIEFSGTGTDRAVRITPAPNQTGLAVITVEVRDPNGAMSQTSFELIVNGTNGPPVVVVNPQDQRVNAGVDVSLRVVATGPGPLLYQWQKDGSDLIAQTNSILRFASIQRTNRGSYRAVVRNANGSTPSTTASVEVIQGARITAVSRTGNSVQLTSESATGQRYTLEYCDSLRAGIWTSLNTIDGTGSPITFTDASANVPSRFYRIRIE